MKRFFLVLLAILLMGVLIFGGCGGQEPAQPATPPAPTIPTYTNEEAGEHVGETATVCGPCAVGFVITMEDPPPTVLALGKSGASDNPDATFFMPGNFAINITPVADQIPGDPTTYYVGKNLCVTGEITLSPIDKPEIVVTDLSQIEVK